MSDTPEHKQLHRRLKETMSSLSLAANDEQSNQLINYLEALQRWNKTYNLTAIRNLDDMLVQHINDCLAIVPSISKKIASLNISGNRARILDIGSGAGLPGFVLAVMLPNVDITCVDTVEKKTTFIKQVISQLKMGNLSAIHARAEKLDVQMADIVVSRAFATLRDFINTAQHHVKANGCFAAMKGKQPDEEIEAISSMKNWKVSKIEELFVPELDAQRCLVWLERNDKSE